MTIIIVSYKNTISVTIRYISGFRREVDKNCALLASYTQRKVLILYRLFGKNKGPIGCTETSVRNYHYILRNMQKISQFWYTNNCTKCVKSVYIKHLALWLRCCDTNRKVAGSIPAGVSGFFIDIKSFRSHYDPGVDSASNRNEYQEHFLGGKGGRCVRLTTLPPSCVVMKAGNLNFLEPSGLLRTCNGTALTLFIWQPEPHFRLKQRLHHFFLFILLNIAVLFSTCHIITLKVNYARPEFKLGFSSD